MLLKIDNVVKEYGKGFRANDGISLEIERGEVFGLLGPNGAGKSTLVNQIVGLLTPTSGTITLDGVDLGANPAHARKFCSFQPQSDVPIDGFTPVQAIELIGRLRGGRRADISQRTRQLIKALDIEEWMGMQGQQLSDGVKRLVGYCMAAIVPKDVVILDEPTNDVDPLRRRYLWKQIGALAEGGTAVLLVTHNVLEAERVVDRLAIIDGGKVLGSGTPASFKSAEGNDLRLELILDPAAEPPEVPEFMKTLSTGRRLRTAVPPGAVAMAVEWAKMLQERGVAEEFSISPISLEDVYVKIIGRPDVLEEGTPVPPPAAG